MATRIISVLLLFLPAFSSAQKLSTTDWQVIKLRCQIGSDTSKYYTSISNTINSSSTYRQGTSAKAVYDFVTALGYLYHDLTLAGSGTFASPLKIAQQGATSGQVLKWNGTTWAPAADDNSGMSYTAGYGITIASGVISADTGQLATQYDLTQITAGRYQTMYDEGVAATQRNGLDFRQSATINPTLTDDSGNNQTDVTLAIRQNSISDFEIGAGAVGTSEIADASIMGADLNQMSATAGQVLAWNGTTWAPAAASGGGHTIRDDGVDLTQRAALNFVSSSTITATGTDDGPNGETEMAFSVPTDGITAAQIAAGGVGTSEIADGTVQFSDFVNITANRILGRVSTNGVMQEISLGAGLGFSGASVINTGDTNAADDITGTGSTGLMAYYTGTQALGAATVNNGLTFSSGTLKFGGTLGEARTLNTSTYTMSYSGTYGGNNGFNHYYNYTASGTTPPSIYDDGLFYFNLQGSPTFTQGFHSLFRGRVAQSGTMPNVKAFQFEVLGTGNYGNRVSAMDLTITDGITADNSITAVIANYGGAAKTSPTSLLVTSSQPTSSGKFTHLNITSTLDPTNAAGYWGIYSSLSSTFNNYLGVGKVGINNTTLDAQLNIKGTGTTSGTYGLVVSNSAGVTATATLVVRDDRQVGIGTNAPNATLHIAGHTQSDGILISRGTGNPVSSVGAAGLRLYNTTGGTGGTYNIESSNSGDLNIYGGATPPLLTLESNTYGVAHGEYASSTIYGQFAHANGRFAADGDAQAIELVFRVETTGTADAELFLDGSAVRAILPANSVWSGRLDAVAICTAAGNGAGAVTGDVLAINGQVAIKRVGTSTSIVPATVIATSENANTSMTSGDIPASADDTNEALKILFQKPTTAGSTTTYRVVAVFRGTQIKY